MFIQKQILFMLALLPEEPISASVKTANLFCSQGLYHLAPLTHWGSRRPLDPSPGGVIYPSMPPTLSYSPAT